MVTILCLLLMLFQIKRTSCPLNIIITCAQLAAMGLEVDGNLHTQLVCYIGQTFTNIVVTSLGVFNLDFFHTVIPPLCISPSFKSIDILLFDYVIASYPFFLTMLIYLCIVVYDGQHISFLSNPLSKCFGTFIHLGILREQLSIHLQLFFCSHTQNFYLPRYTFS